jgi:hypothetical protein
MKKLYFFSAIFFLSAVGAVAQITIGQADMPQPGDTIRLSRTTNTSGLPAFSNTGANYTWDYSMLKPQSQTVDTFLRVNSTPLAYQFFFNNIIFYPSYVSTVAQASPNISNNPPVTITNVINYYKDGASAYESVGFGASINGIPTSTKDDSTDYVYHFPMNFSNADSSDSKYHVSIPHFAYYGMRQHRVNHVDGWGTLKTPFGTFQALRVTTQLFIVDTVYIDTFHFGFATPLQQLQYKWLVNGQHLPVLQINENVIANNPVLSSIVYRDSIRRALGINEINASKGIRMFPNPANNVVYLQSESEIKGIELEIYNMMGQTIMQKHIERMETGTPLAIDISGVSQGMYFVRIRSGDGVSTFKFTKEQHRILN